MNIIIRYSLLFVLITMLFGCNSAKQPIVVKDNALKIATWNVNYGSRDIDEISQTINKSGADIVFLQETSAFHELYLANALKSQFKYIRFFYGAYAGGQAVLSKYKLADIEWFKPDQSWFKALTLTAETPAGTIRFVSVHLHPPVTNSGSWIKGYFTTDVIRLAEVKSIVNKVGNELPTIILGDFNEDRDDAIKWLSNVGFTDLQEEFGNNKNTWEWETSLITLRRRLDYIMYRGPLESCYSEVMQSNVSDHFPLIGHFQKK